MESASHKARYLINLHAGGLFIFKKSFDLLLVIEQQAEHIPLGFVAALEPDDLRRIAIEQAELMKIRVLGDDGEAVVFGLAPDGEIVGLVEIDKLDLRCTWVDGFQLLQQPEREVLIQ